MKIFKGWSISSYSIFALGVLTLIPVSLFINGFNFSSIASLIGSLAGFLSVVLIVNKHPYAGYAGMISAVIYMFISWSLGNYSDTLLNILFLLFLNIPLIINKNYKTGSPRSIKDHPEYEVYLLGIFIILYIVLFAIEFLIFKAPRPWISVLAADLGITASIATSFFVLKESFVLWSTQNIFQMVLWGITFYQTESGIALLMMITYIFYTMNALTAFTNRKWYNNEH